MSSDIHDSQAFILMVNSQKEIEKRAVGSRMVQEVIETVCKTVIDILNLGKVFSSVLFWVAKILRGTTMVS